MRDLSERTLGELAAMRDTLYVAEQQTVTSRCDQQLKSALFKVISVLDAIVQDKPFLHSSEVRQAVAFRATTYAKK